ncbi:Cullin-4B [Artomyces pyxidatus]|uniref:Cullin-4B n=1 Tax=Artomyces pyxidatus TaxID=48021 RepID=A0ACB8STY3_9AGAM|nr:Cullin-4B [Artomyces pyxidatus]
MDVISLLTLSSSDAFSGFRTAVVDESPSASRKVARLDADSDSGSAFRSRASAAARTGDKQKGPIRVQVAGAAPVSSRPQRFNDSLLAQLRQCIRLLLTRYSQEDLPLPYERIYSACRHIVFIMGMGEGLTDILKLELEKCVGNLEKGLSEEIADGMDYFSPLARSLTWFEGQVGILTEVLTYLDRAYLLSSMTSVRQMADALLESRILQDTQFHSRLLAGITDWASWEREHKEAHTARPHIREVIRHLQAHGMYNGRFEMVYLQNLNTFYTAQSKSLATPGKDALVFLAFCLEKIDEEMTRAKAVLPQGSWDAVREATERGLLAEHLEWFARGTIGTLIDAKDLPKLSTLNGLLHRASGTKELMEAFTAFVQARVVDIVTDAPRDGDMVERLLEFKAAADLAVQKALTDDVGRPQKDLGYALTDAFSTGFKARPTKPAEMIAKHVDRLMRKGQRGASDEEFEAQLDAALALYRFTEDKDVFRTFYHRALAKRLLLERSASDDFEKAILKKLKEQYDPEFSMGDHMFNDLALSRDSMREYHARIGGEDVQKLNVMVLQQSFWPFTTRPAKVDLPVNMQGELTAFSQFYQEKHQGHRLEWNHGLGTVSLKGVFTPGQKELSVTLYQAVVLLLFNNAKEIPFLDLKASTGLEDAELRRTLQSLACGKKKVLKKRPVGKDVDDGDIFEFNDDFSDPRARVHINSIQVKETPDETKRTHHAIEGDRKHYLDAAIVRIMKARKRMTYEQIKTETIDAVKKHFVPDVSSIKQRVDSLVEQDYIKRDEDDRNVFVYVA